MSRMWGDQAKMVAAADESPDEKHRFGDLLRSADRVAGVAAEPAADERREETDGEAAENEPEKRRPTETAISTTAPTRPDSSPICSAVVSGLAGLARPCRRAAPGRSRSNARAPASARRPPPRAAPAPRATGRSASAAIAAALHQHRKDQARARRTCRCGCRA